MDKAGAALVVYSFVLERYSEVCWYRSCCVLPDAVDDDLLILSMDARP